MGDWGSVPGIANVRGADEIASKRAMLLPRWFAFARSEAEQAGRCTPSAYLPTILTHCPHRPALFTLTHSVNHRRRFGASHITGCHVHPLTVTASMMGCFNSCKLNV